jgi:hypothetical protein
MSGFSGTVSAAAAVLALYATWASLDPIKQNNAVNYTIEKLSGLEQNVGCDKDQIPYRILMNVVATLRPASFGSPQLPPPLPPPRCAIILSPTGADQSGRPSRRVSDPPDSLPPDSLVAPPGVRLR